MRALRLGANVYLTKPIEASALTEQVTRLLDRRRPGREAWPTRLLTGSSIVAFSVISFLSRTIPIETSPVASPISRLRLSASARDRR